jgi:hypothetical protein
MSPKNPQPGNRFPPSVNQNSNKPDDLLTDLSAKKQVSVLTVLFRSPSLAGRALRTLLYYARRTQAPLRDQDLYILMAISAAEAAARRESET